MAHRTIRDGYGSFTERINRFPQGASPSDLLKRILELLVSEREAGLLSLLPIRPFNARNAAARWRMTELEARAILDGLADRGMLLDIEKKDGPEYVLPPPMAGFFEFSLMRVREDIDQRVLSELFYQYLNVEEDFVRALFAGGGTQLGRVLVHEDVLTDDQSLHVLDHERATEVVRSARSIGIGVCYCRHKMRHLDRACDAPLDICMTFNTAADSLVRHGIARGSGQGECLDLLDKARGLGLVQFAENVREGVNFICNCCGCCCEAMLAAKRFSVLRPIHTTRFIPVIDRSVCTGCGKCVEACPVEAMGLVSSGDPADRRRMTARVDTDVCLGCGVCVRACPRDALSLDERGERVVTPVNTAHRVVLMAVERGKLQELITDFDALADHRAMAAILGAILRFPPVKRALAGRQMHSRYIENLFRRIDY